MRPFTAYLPDSLHERVRRVAYETRQSMSSLTVEALKRYFEEEEVPKMKFKDWKITTGVLAGNLFGAADGIDEEASARRYVELCREALEEEFPGAEIRVDCQLHAEGSLPLNLRTQVEAPNLTGPEMDGYIMQVDGACSRVFEEGDWMIERGRD